MVVPLHVFWFQLYRLFRCFDLHVVSGEYLLNYRANYRHIALR